MSTSAGSDDFVSHLVEKAVAGLAARLDVISQQLTAIHEGTGNLRKNMSDMSQQVAELQHVTREIRQRPGKEGEAGA